LRELPKEKQEAARARLSKVFGIPFRTPAEDEEDSVPERDETMP
jgi:hypothetical protein